MTNLTRRTALTGLLALPLAAGGLDTSGVAHAAPRVVTSNTTGRHNGFFFTYWKDAGSARMTLGDRAGSYQVDWDLGSGNFVGGLGWQPGATWRRVGYNAGTWQPDGNAYLTLYGWTRDPLVEYYVVDSWGNWRPPGGDPVGSVTSDGGSYELYRTRRVDKPSIESPRSTFYQYWSVRRAKRPTGGNATITFGNHVDAWGRRGWRLGSPDYQVMATEGFQSSGTSNLTVWQA